MKSLDDILFEHRNKEYGCYDLRISYKKRFMMSYCLVMGVFIFLSLFIYFRDEFHFNKHNKTIENGKIEIVTYDHDLLPVINDLPFLPIISKAAEDKQSESENITKQIRRKNILVKTESRKFIPLQPVTDSSFRKMAEDLLERHKNSTIKNYTSQKDSLILVLEKLPSFPGGYTAIQSFFLKHQHYPENALMKGIRGTTIVSFIVNAQGIVENPKVVVSTDPELDKEAVRLVSIMPKWQPGYSKGKPISCKLVMPVDFLTK